MKISANQKLINKVFYNNLILIIYVFCAICLLTSCFLQFFTHKSYDYKYLDNQTKILYGPININTKPQSYCIKTSFNGENSSAYITGEVLNEEQETIYEFGKDLWHESGYDSEGRWVESDRFLRAYLTFRDKGKYYILLYADTANFYNVSIEFSKLTGSYVVHYKVGVLFLLFATILFYFNNLAWANQKIKILVEKIGDEL